jgi:hypothetical protein
MVYHQTLMFSFLSGCNLSYLWIPEAMEDLLASCPSFMVHQIVFFFFLSERNLSDLWFPKEMEDLLPSCLSVKNQISI